MAHLSYEPLYVTYLVYFNRDRDYFECHEVLEELWLKLDRDPVYKGLLQVAVGLYHFRNGNYRGGHMMLDSAVHRLEHAPSQALGINMVKLVEEARICARQLAEAVMTGTEELQQEPPVYRDMTIEIVEPGLRRPWRRRRRPFQSTSRSREVLGVGKSMSSVSRRWKLLLGEDRPLAAQVLSQRKRRMHLEFEAHDKQAARSVS